MARPAALLPYCPVKVESIGFTPLIRASRTFSRREKDLDGRRIVFSDQLFAEIPLPPGAYALT